MTTIALGLMPYNAKVECLKKTEPDPALAGIMVTSFPLNQS